MILPPTPSEFADRIRAMHADLGLLPPEGTNMLRLVDDAVGSRRGNRCLENYACTLLINHGSNQSWEPPEIDPTLLW
jgi:hypothetical protein